MRLVTGLLLTVALAFAVPALAQDEAMLDRAFAGALSTFEAVFPGLSTREFGVDTAEYRDALSLLSFQSSVWGGIVRVAPVARPDGTGSCGRFAAFVRIPPENGVVSLVLCPQFFTPGADGLRELTILHEMVHVVAGPDECQAMAFAARIEQAARGRFTPVDGYWRASGCEGSEYRLPQ